MHNLPFLRSVIMALLISAATAVLYLSLSLIVDQVSAIQLCTSAATLAYLVYLLCQADARYGRISTIGAFLTCTLLAAFLWPSTLELAAFNVGFIWLVRAVYFHKHALLALSDLVISVVTFTAAIAAALQSNSIFLAFWSFFLAQAMILPLLNYLFAGFVAQRNPTRQGASVQVQSDHNQQQFQRAYLNAESALRKLADAS